MPVHSLAFFLIPYNYWHKLQQIANNDDNFLPLKRFIKAIQLNIAHSNVTIRLTVTCAYFLQKLIGSTNKIGFKAFYRTPFNGIRVITGV